MGRIAGGGETMVSAGWVDKAKVHLALILTGAGFGGYFVLTKASLSGGVDPFVFGTYRDGIGCVTLFLYASCFERYDALPLFCQFCSMVGLGLRSTTPYKLCLQVYSVFFFLTFLNSVFDVRRWIL